MEKPRKQGGSCCAVVGCSNSYFRLRQWKKQVCVAHAPLHHEDCPCLVPFRLFLFPKNDEEKLKWLAAINRKNFKCYKSALVCSHHFVEGRPTKINPYPAINLGYSRKVVSGRRPIVKKDPVLKGKKRRKNVDAISQSSGDEQVLTSTFVSQNNSNDDVEAACPGISETHEALSSPCDGMISLSEEVTVAEAKTFCVVDEVNIVNVPAPTRDHVYCNPFNDFYTSAGSGFEVIGDGTEICTLNPENSDLSPGNCDLPPENLELSCPHKNNESRFDCIKNGGSSKNCVAINCPNIYRRGELPSFHRFPKDTERKKKWIAAIDRKDWHPTPNSWLCGNHFQTGKPNADPNHPDYIPTIFEKPNDALYEAGFELRCSNKRFSDNNEDSGNEKENAMADNEFVEDHSIPEARKCNMLVAEKMSMEYNEASNAQWCTSYKKIIDDLSATIENINNGVSSVSTNSVNNFLECKIQPPANHPIVILLYENRNGEEFTNAFPDTIVKVEQEDETESAEYSSCSKAFTPTQSASENDLLEENSECFFKKEISILFERRDCNFFQSGILIDENSGKLMGNNDNITKNTEHRQIQLKQEDSVYESERIDDSDTVHLHSYELISENADDNCDKHKNTNLLNSISRNSGLVETAGVISNKNNALSIRTVSSEINGSTSTITTNKKKNKRKRNFSTNVKKHRCDYCEKTFFSSSQKKVHERMHTGEKPYGCSYCNKKFTHIGSKQLHERTHTGEKPYECAYCKKAFASLSNKAVHERSHTGERPYKCDFCEKSFIRSGDKITHQRIHTGEKPYSCDHCDKNFARFSHKLLHEKLHSGEKSYKCEFCEKAFFRSGDKRKHERSHIEREEAI